MDFKVPQGPDSAGKKKKKKKGKSIRKKEKKHFQKILTLGQSRQIRPNMAITTMNVDRQLTTKIWKLHSRL